MTVSEYAAKYGITHRAVYYAVYAARLCCTRADGRIDIPEQPPPPTGRFRQADELLDLPDYILSLIWLTGTISGDAILIRNTDRYFADVVSHHIDSSVWSRQRPDGRSQYVCKISGKGIVQALRELGFAGSKDACRLPPPVEPLIFAKSFAETHTSFVWQLQYDRHRPRDKRYARYAPCITSCAAPAILEGYADALHALGIAPARKISPAANSISACIRYTSHTQLKAMHTLLSPDLGSGTHIDFWAAFDDHISTPPVPYFVYTKED